MPNTFAYLMLFGWPLVAVVLFRVLPLQKALIWTIFGGYLLLPSNMHVKLPMIPVFDKTMIPNVSAAILCLFHAPRVDKGHGKPFQTGMFQAASGQRLSGQSLVIGLLILLIAVPFATVLTNREMLVFGPHVLPALRLYDGVSLVIEKVVMVLPFLLAWRFLATRASQRLLLQAFVFGALVYSVPALFEVRMSPQLHTWVYGYFPHEFAQHVRDGGFRPVVFLRHGLLLGILFSMAILAALALWREAVREGTTASGWLFAAIWLTGNLIFAKTLGPLSIAAMLAPFLFLPGQRPQIFVAMTISLVLLLYPTLRGAGLVPVDAVYETALSISQERADSLKFRLVNEDALLDRANEKPFFGWGSWGRNQIFDPESGAELSIADGLWIGLIGSGGWLNYIAYFGLFTLPILLFAVRRRRYGPSLLTPGLMLVFGAALIDFLPNAGLTPYIWLFSGALTGFVLKPTAEENPAEASGQTKSVGGAPPSWLTPQAGPHARRQPRQNRNQPQYQDK
jgi:hypothetical protein